MTMLQSALTPIPSHAMTCFKLPKSLTKKIQSALTRFWRDSSDGVRKIAWVSWDSMVKPKGKGGLGFQDFECFNDAFLAKLRWRVLNQPEGLLSRVLKGKYCCDEGFLTVPCRTAASHGWRSVLIGRDLIVKNAGWAIGNGESVKVWSDPWLSLTSQERPIGPVAEALQDTKVAELIDHNTGEWDREKIQLIAPFVEEKILLIKPSKSGAPDKLIWLRTLTGEYTTKSGYQTGLEDNQIIPAPLRCLLILIGKEGFGTYIQLRKSNFSFEK